MNVRHLIQSVRDGAYAWPGGYPKFWVTTDGGALCHKCVRSEIWQVARSTRDGERDGWAVEGSDCNWEDPCLYCDHCSERIESAYAEDDAEDA